MTRLETFAPGPETARSFRDALGRFATGVTVVTCRDAEQRPLGITANSFASVSLDPPLVLWCPAKSSRRFMAFRDAPGYAVHILGADQMDLGARFAKKGHAFEGLEWRAALDGTPLIETALARFLCIPHAFHDAGDHAIAVGRVVEAAMRDGEPLIFTDGAYSAPQDPRRAP